MYTKLIILFSVVCLSQYSLVDSISASQYFNGSYVDYHPEMDVDTLDSDFLPDSVSDNTCFNQTKFMLNVRKSLKIFCSFIRPCDLRCHQKLRYKPHHIFDNDGNKIHFMRLTSTVKVHRRKDKSDAKEFVAIHDRIYKISHKRRERSHDLSYRNYTHFISRRALTGITSEQARKIVGAYEVGVGVACLAAGASTAAAVGTAGLASPMAAFSVSACGVLGLGLLTLEGLNKIFSWW